jgi:hypothetical protein
MACICSGDILAICSCAIFIISGLNMPAIAFPFLNITSTIFQAAAASSARHSVRASEHKQPRVWSLECIPAAGCTFVYRPNKAGTGENMWTENILGQF